MQILTIGVYGFTHDTFREALAKHRPGVFVDTRRRRGVRGSQYSFANSQRLGGYSSVDAALGYRADQGPWGTKGFSVSLDVNNLFNARKLTAFAGNQSVSGAPLYFGLPGRGAFVDMAVKF